jgi:hypothetical protein
MVAVVNTPAYWVMVLAFTMVQSFIVQARPLKQMMLVLIKHFNNWQKKLFCQFFS